jgi:hypothetical protein
MFVDHLYHLLGVVPGPSLARNSTRKMLNMPFWA